MNTTIATIQTANGGRLYVSDHNGKLELVADASDGDYAALDPQQAASLIAILAKWLADQGD